MTCFRLLNVLKGYATCIATLGSSTAISKAYAYYHFHLSTCSPPVQLNILVTHDGTPKICDFGHARFTTDPAHALTSDISSQFHATTRYMSPELFTDPKNKPTVFSDVWAYGCVALEVGPYIKSQHTVKAEGDSIRY